MLNTVIKNNYIKIFLLLFLTGFSLGTILCQPIVYNKAGLIAAQNSIPKGKISIYFHDTSKLLDNDSVNLQLEVSLLVLYDCPKFKLKVTNSKNVVIRFKEFENINNLEIYNANSIIFEPNRYHCMFCNDTSRLNLNGKIENWISKLNANSIEFENCNIHFNKIEINCTKLQFQQVHFEVDTFKITNYNRLKLLELDNCKFNKILLPVNNSLEKLVFYCPKKSLSNIINLQNLNELYTTNENFNREYRNLPNFTGLKRVYLPEKTNLNLDSIEVSIDLFR